MKRSRVILSIALAFSFVAQANRPVRASDWTNSVGGTWNDANNWDAGGVPNGAGSTANLVGPLSGNSAITLDISPTVGVLNFNDGNGNSFTLQDGGNNLTLNNGGTAQINVSTGTVNVVSVPVSLANPVNVTLNAGTKLTLSDNVTGGQNFTVWGNGTLRLEGSNAFNQFIQQSAAFASDFPTVEITTANAFGSAPIRIGGNYGGLNLKNDSGGPLTLANDVAFNLAGGRTFRLYGSDLKFTGTLSSGGGGALNWPVTVYGSNTVELAGTINAAPQLSGAGSTFIISGDGSGMPTGAGGNDRFAAWYGTTLKIATDTIPGATHLGLYGQELPWAHEPVTVIAEGTDRTLGGPLHFNGYAGRVIVSGSNQLTFNGDIAEFWNSAGSGNPFYFEVDTGSQVTFNGNWNDYPIQGGNAKTLYKTGGGTMVINGDMTTAAVDHSPLIVSAGTLAGNGTLTSDASSVSSGAFLSPGTSAGTLTAAGNLTMLNGSTYVYELDDLMRVLGTLDLDDNWTLQLTGPGFASGGQVTLFEYGSLAASPDLNPSFTYVNLGFTPAGLSVVDDSANQRIVLMGISMAIPEPSMVLLVLLGGALLWRNRSSRRS